MKIQNFQTFKPIDVKKIQLKLYDHLLVEKDTEPEFCFKVQCGTSRQWRLRTFEEIVSDMFSDAVLDELIEFNLQKYQHDELPNVFYGKNDSMLIFI